MTWLPLEWVLLGLVMAPLWLVHQTACQIEGRWEVHHEHAGRTTIYFTTRQPRQQPNGSLTFIDINGITVIVPRGAKVERID